jgi:type VI secretion system secreted protein Hcp
VVSCVLATGRAQAQSSIVMEIPGVPGESTISGFVGQIDISSFQFGAGSTACGGAGTTSFSEVVVTKSMDKASVPLYRALADHTVYPTATIRFVRTDGQVSESYQLTNAVMTGVSTSSGGSRPSESLSIAYSQIVMTYTFFDGSGKNGGTQSTTLVLPACPGP